MPNTCMWKQYRHFSRCIHSPTPQKPCQTPFCLRITFYLPASIVNSGGNLMTLTLD